MNAQNKDRWASAWDALQEIIISSLKILYVPTNIL